MCAMKYKHLSEQQRKTIIRLAYANRYAFPLFAAFIPFLVSRISGINFNILLGFSMILFGGYELIGYRLKFRHIFCSYQDAYHLKMTPEKIEWEKLRKADVYGVPLIFITFGIISLVYGIIFE